MPASHQLLLRYLMVVLRRVGDNSTSNEMTSYNVAACIGQCLLWPCSDARMSPDSHLAAAKRTNQVVEKMIDAAHEIFGSERLPFLQKSEFSSNSKASKNFFPDIVNHNSTYAGYLSYHNVNSSCLNTCHPARNIGFICRSFFHRTDALSKSYRIVLLHNLLLGIRLRGPFPST